MYAGGGHYDGGGGAANSNSLFGGGGFVLSQSTNAPESGGGGGGGGFKTRGPQTLLPLTVKQIMDASQISDDKSSFAVDGTEVRLVGRMLNKVERVTDVAFTLDDGTGGISVNRWENESIDTEEMTKVNNGDYVIVNGGLRGFQGKRQVVAYSVRRVTNFNDVTHHFLHCIHVHLDLTRSKGSLLQPQVNANAETVNSNQTMSRNDMTWKQAQHPYNQAPTFPKLENATEKDLTNLVLSVFQDPAFVNLEHGITMDDVKTRIKISDDVLRRILSEQVDAGALYSTIDDNHLRSTVNG